MEYQRPALTVVGSVREVTLVPIQACKYGHGADNAMPNEGLADLSGQWKDKPGCFLS